MTTETKAETANKDESKPQRFVSDDEAGLRLDRWFKRHYATLTHGQLQKWLRTGQIRVDGKRADASDRLEAGQALRLPPALLNESALTKTPSGKGRPVRNPEKLKSLVLYKDDDVVAINKPAGLAVQGGTGLKENLDDSLMVFSTDGVTRPKLVHRLDRDTSGVLLIARNDFAAMKLAAAFRSHSTQKIYWAVTMGVPKPAEGSINAPLIKRGQLMYVAEDEDKTEAKRAKTLYQVVETVHKKMAFVALWPLTGRTHQLRVHLAHIGTPILGDRLYGPSAEDSVALSGLNLGHGLHLHARRIIIPHPRKGLIDVTAPLSSDMRRTWQSLHFSEKAKAHFDDHLEDT